MIEARQLAIHVDDPDLRRELPKAVKKRLLIHVLYSFANFDTAFGALAK